MKNLDDRIREYAACFDDSPFPCGIIEVIKNEHGVPVDIALRYVNEALAAINRHRCNELITRTFYDLYTDADEKWLPFFTEIAYSDGERRSVDFSTQFNRYINIRASRISTGFCVVFLVDVTDEKKIQQYCMNQLAEQRRVLEQRYEHSLSMRDQVDRDAIGSFRLNLTKNICVKECSKLDDILKLQEHGTVDGFFSGCYSNLKDPQQLAEYKEIFNRTKLLNSFRDGNVTLSLEHKYLLCQDRNEWVKTSVHMAQNPETGDVEGLIYATSINNEKIAASILERFVNIEYEFIALIDVRTGELSVFKARSRDIQGVPVTCGSYSEAIQNSIASNVIEDQADDCVAKMSLVNIQAELERYSTYTVSFTFKTETGQFARKKWLYTYLDGSRSVIAYTRSDITELYNDEIDPITNVYNRTYFVKAARKLLNDMPNERFFLARCDLDRFKVYNDIYGTDAGDRLLALMASALKKMPLRPFVFGHMEADHFVCVAPLSFIDRMPDMGKISQYLKSLQPDFDFSPRIGVYIINNPSLDISLMIDRALIALRSSKGKYNEHIVYYDESMRESLLLEQEFLGDIRAALENNEFEVYLQPQYNHVKNELIGVEALVRWFHPVKGSISPKAFIKILEQNRYVTKLDEYVWEFCCKLLREWLDRGLKPVPISVNISRVDIYNPHLCEILCGLIQKYRLSYSLLRLEITESAYMDNPGQLLGAIGKLRDMGFVIEMDDFGSGYSSLNSLKDMPVDVLKLDLRFLTPSEDGGRSGIILTSIVRMAHWLNLQIIAEGVETRSQADFLKSIGCELVQGFLYAEPMSAEKFSTVLAAVKKGNLDEACSVPSFFDEKEFWDPEAQATIIFNRYVGAAGIFEYRCGNVEATHFNDKFFEVTGVSRSEFMNFSGHLLDALLPEDKSAVISMLEEAKNTDKEIVCDSRWIQVEKPGELLWLRIRARQIARSVDRNAFYISVENITEYKRLLAEKRELAERLSAIECSAANHNTLHSG